MSANGSPVRTVKVAGGTPSTRRRPQALGYAGSRGLAWFGGSPDGVACCSSADVAEAPVVNVVRTGLVVAGEGCLRFDGELVARADTLNQIGSVNSR